MENTKDLECAENCTVCGNEFPSTELNSISLGSTNLDSFKICKHCMNSSSIKNDFEEVKNIVANHLKFYLKIKKSE